MNLIKGETVTVITPNNATDELGEPVVGEPAKTAVENVVVAPGATSDLDASRPEGVQVAYTLCFPKTFTADLAGCAVLVRGDGPFRVMGDPQRYTEANTPGDWNLTVEVSRADG